jgi:hypothetical protein
MPKEANLQLTESLTTRLQASNWCIYNVNLYVGTDISSCSAKEIMAFVGAFEFYSFKIFQKMNEDNGSVRDSI